MELSIGVMDISRSSVGPKVVMEPRRRPSPRYYIYSVGFLRVVRFVDAMLSLFRRPAPAPAVPSHPSRILVANCADFGDIVLMLPALEALRKLFPQAEIGFLSSEKTRAVLAGTHLVDRHHVVGSRFVHILTRERGLARLRALGRFVAARRAMVRELKAARYEVALDLYLYPFPVSPLFYMAGIPVRAGYTSGGFGPLLTHPIEAGAEPRSILDSPRALFSTLWPERAAELPPFKPHYPGHPLHDVAPLGSGARYWVIHMGAGAVFKEWPDEQWRSLLVALAGRGVKLLLTGSGARERQRVERMIASVGDDRIQSAVDRPWAEFVAVVARAERVICLDSSIVHVAAAFGVPTTALFTGINDLVEWGPRNELCDVLMAPVGCAPCNRRDCVEMTCIREVSVSDVLVASLEKGKSVEVTRAP